MSRNLSTKRGSVESLNCLTRCGCRPCARQMRWTELALIADDFRHHGGSPVGRLGGRFGLGEGHDAVGNVRSQRRNARGACLIVQEAVVARLHEAFLPAPHTGLRLAGPAHDLIGADAVRAQQDDLSPPDMLVRGVAIPRERLQAAAIRRLESDGNSSSHAPDSHALRSAGNPLKDLNVRRDPLATRWGCRGSLCRRSTVVQRFRVFTRPRPTADHRTVRK